MRIIILLILLLIPFVNFSQKKIEQSLSLSVNITPLPFVLSAGNSMNLLFLNPKLKNKGNQSFIYYRNLLQNKHII
jgi:hypothetical protein